MASHEVWLRCRPLEQSEGSDVPATENAEEQEESFEGEKGGLLRRPVFAHWQLECHGQIYEIGRKGAAYNPFNQIEFHSGLAKQDPSLIYRKKIGMTSKSAKQIIKNGKDIVRDGNYNLFLRNCQTTIKKLAEAIIQPPDMDSTFSWPWRAAHVAMIVVAGVAAGGTAYFLWPVQGVIQVVGASAASHTCPADWSMCGKFMTALQQYWSKGEVTDFVWRVGDKILHRMPLRQLVGQWARKKLVPLMKCAVGFAVSLLALVPDPEWLENSKQLMDGLYYATKRTWAGFLEWLKGLLSRLKQKSNTIVIDSNRLRVLV